MTVSVTGAEQNMNSSMASTSTGENNQLGEESSTPEQRPINATGKRRFKVEKKDVSNNDRTPLPSKEPHLAEDSAIMSGMCDSNLVILTNKYMLTILFVAKDRRHLGRSARPGNLKEPGLKHKLTSLNKIRRQLKFTPATTQKSKKRGASKIPLRHRVHQ